MTKQFDAYQEDYKKFYNISSVELDELAKQLPHPKYLELIHSRFDYMPSVNDFSIESYNNIKDANWPECRTISDLINLPQNIIDECRDIHNFDIGIRSGAKIDPVRWQNYNGGCWPIHELIRYKYIVLDLKEFFVGKNIVDFACHAGFASLSCLHNGAKSSFATNIRPDFVKLANECLSLAGFGDRFKAVVADIHDYDYNTNICTGRECILIYGVLYHTHDSFEILESIAKANPKNIIIDTAQDKFIMDIPEPLVRYTTEDSSSCWNGWYNHYDTAFIGAPNEPWFDYAMKFFGYKLVKRQRYKTLPMGEFHMNNLGDKVVMVYEK